MNRKILGICFALVLFAWSVPAEESPWVKWRLGQELTVKGDNARDRGDHKQAIRFFGEAAAHYRELKKIRPDWNQQVIDARLQLCEAELAKARRALGDVAEPVSAAPGRAGVPPPKTVYEERPATAINAELEQYKAKLLAALVELDELRKKEATRKGAANEAEALLRENRELQQNLKVQEKRYRDLQLKLDAPDEERKKMQAQLDEARTELRSSENRLEQAQEKITRLDREFLALTQRRVGELAAQKTTAESLAAAEKELTILREFRRNTLAGKNEELLRIRDLDGQIEQARAQEKRRTEEIEKLNLRLEEAMRKGGDAGALNAELAGENRKSRAELEALQKRYDAVVLDRQDIQARQRSMQLEVADLKKSIASSDTALKRAEQIAAERAAEAKTAHDAREKAEKERAAERTERREQGNVLKAYQDRLARMDEQLKTERAVSARAQTRNDELRRELEDENVRLNASIRRAAGENDALKTEKEKQTEQLAVLRRDLAGRDVKIAEMGTLAPQLQTLKDERERENRLLEKTREELARARETESKLEKAHTELAELAKLQTTLDGARNELLTVARKNKELADEVARLELALQQTKKSAKTAEAQAVQSSAAEAKAARAAEEAKAAAKRSTAEAKAAEAKAAKAAEEAQIAEAKAAKAAEEAKALAQKSTLEAKAAEAKAAEAQSAAAQSAEEAKTAAQKSAEEARTLAQKSTREAKAAAEKAIAEAKAAAQKSAGDAEAAAKAVAEAKAARIKSAEAEKAAKNQAVEVAKAAEKAIAEAKAAAAKAEAEARTANAKAAAAEAKAAQAIAEAKTTAVAVASVPRTEDPVAITAADIPKLLDEGRRAERAEDFAVARWNFRAVLEADPGNFEANAALGALHIRREEYRQAIPPLGRAHLLRPQDIAVQHDYAAALLGDGQNAAAVALLEPSLEKAATNPGWMQIWSRALAATGDRRAEQALRRAAQLSPQSAEANVALARFLCTRATATDEAARYYGRARKLGAKADPELERKLGGKLSEQSELQEFLRSAATEAEKSGDQDAVLWYARQLTELEPGNPVPLLRLNGYQLRQNQAGAAAALWSALPEAPEGGLIAAVAALDAREYAKSGELLADALKRNKGEFKLPPEAAILKSEIEKRLKDAPEALKKAFQTVQ